MLRLRTCPEAHACIPSSCLKLLCRRLSCDSNHRGAVTERAYLNHGQLRQSCQCYMLGSLCFVIGTGFYLADGIRLAQAK